VKAEECELLTESGRSTRLRLKNGLIYSFLDIPSTDSHGTLTGQASVSGQGTLSLWTSTCVRPPSLKAQAFSHDTKAPLGTFELTNASSTLTFMRDFAPYERGYVYIRVSGEAVLSHVSGVYSETQESVP
jgi:hypothetical protein